MEQTPTKNTNGAQRGQISGRGAVYTPELCRLIRETATITRTTCPHCGRVVRYYERKKAACIYCGEEETK